MQYVAVESVTKRYGDLLAVDSLQLEVEEGEHIAVLGPSGCGKTTTLHMLAGLEEPTEGEIFIGGDRVTHLGARRRNVGLIFQDYSVFPHMSPLRNIEFGLRVRGWPRSKRLEKVKEVADIVELGEQELQRPTSGLSPSELQRVAIARTLATEPRLVLLDEPLSNLEPELRGRTRAKLKRLFDDLGQTTVYVTHDQVEAMALANRIAVMAQGRLEQFGSPEDVYLRPANVFVAGFLGSPPMNFLPGQLEEGRHGLSVVTAGGALDLGGRSVDMRDGGREVVLGIRPEHLAVAAAPNETEPEGRGRLAGTVFEVEPLGSETVVSITIGETIIKALVEPERKLEVDARVPVSVSPDHVQLFDLKTEASRLSAVRW